METRTVSAQLSDEIARIATEAGPSVVRIEGRARRPSTGIAWTTDTIVTADHAVERDEGIGAGLADGRTVPATLVGRDAALDLAVLRLETAVLAPPRWDDAEDLGVGNLVLAVARPGRSARASLGIVGTAGGPWRTPGGGRVDRALYTDLGLFPGFSGSLLVDVRGRAVGMNTSGLARDTAVALPVATLRRAVTDLLAHGGTRRGFLGIGTMPVRLPEGMAAAAGQAQGLLVVSAQERTAAADAGMLLGDILVAIGGTPVAQVGDLLEALDDLAPGTPTAVRILRGGVPQQLALVTGARP